MTCLKRLRRRHSKGELLTPANQGHKAHRIIIAVNRPTDSRLLSFSRKYRLSHLQISKYFMNILEGPARNFHIVNHTPNITYEHLCSLMKREYDSDSGELQIQSTFERRSLNGFNYSRLISSHSDGLANLVEYSE